MIGIEKRRSSLRAFAPALALLAGSFLINYIDRGNLGVAAPLLKGELHISGSQLGLVLAAFFWTYTGLQFVVGWAVTRPLRSLTRLWVKLCFNSESVQFPARSMPLEH